ncbi:PilW family protein [Deinococcus peraridilitoris]|uniref:Prepilin-type N-terminal cleavage/methylation domain-containing protein n=1 Tax=Deinococcus peraridilitoris (strain DSM 19664 / LMG 22246 / CIP 109416 / KR-200) TaxID=937777 RepID=L0A0Q5_DEIPD|nr:type II secretion system protein [Deinococcus peraridilitoris]AFZ67473.1 prepilin-type N-terminal cleavage/methylation domain-containing protein [Deinococcus peraridilitoris DSM 19664]
MKPAARQGGFTLIEMLLAMGLVAIVLGFVAYFFIEQQHFTHAQQTREEVQSNVQAAVELVTEDVRNAGSFGVPSVSLPIQPAAALVGVDGGTNPDIIRVRYQRFNYGTATTTGTYSEVDVTYKVRNDAQGVPTLFRSQTPVNATDGCSLSTTIADGANCIAAIQNIVAFNVRYMVRTTCPNSLGIQTSVQATFEAAQGSSTFGGVCSSARSYTAADVYRVEVMVIGRAPLRRAAAGGNLLAGTQQTVPQLAGFTYRSLSFTFDTPSL